MSSSNLIIGWQVNRDLDPIAARAGLDAPRITVPGERIDKHTAIIAQSGSGKSFFLGRYLEEILLRTRSRCVVLDPNGDFSKISEVEKSIPWGKNDYDYEEKRGRITHENQKKEFVDPWIALTKRVRMAPQFASRTSAEPLSIHWADVSAGLVAPDFEPAHIHEVKDCHRIIQALCALWTTLEPKDERDIFKLSRGMILAQDYTSAMDWLDSQFSKQQVVTARTEELLADRGITNLTSTVRNYYEGIAKSDVDRLFETIMRLHSHIPDSSKSYYLSKATSLCHDPIFSKTASKPKTVDDYKGDIIDLSSIGDENTRLLTINAVLRRQWEIAKNAWRDVMASSATEQDTRVPTFIVIDEAHNLIPHEPRSSAATFVREQIRRIAAEGRKYGLFLIIVSQRPDKLDPLVLSECENKVLMRVSSEAVIERARILLGLEDVPRKVLNRVVDFPTGRGLLFGHWVDDTHKLFYSQARRTAEGGKGLDSSYWGKTIESDKSTSTPKRKALKKGSSKKRASK